MRYEFHPEALEEYDGAAHYYAQQHRLCRECHRSHPRRPIALAPIRRGRRCFTRVFPYGILYTIESDFVLIIAVSHCSREPSYWKHRIA